MQYTRQEVLDRLSKQIQQGNSILMFGAGTGLTAKCAEKGGADLIGIYSTAVFRMHGSHLYWPGFHMAIAINIHSIWAKSILPVVKSTPCIAGIGAHDPSVDFDSIIKRLEEYGFSGVNNEPFSGLYGKYFSEQLERAGVGFSREVELIKAAHKNNFFSVAWAMSNEEAARMAAAGADVIGAMIGVTSGGMSGASKTISLEEATDAVRQMIYAAKRENPDVMVLTHGGPFADPDTAAYSIHNTEAVGYASGSSGERIPTESAL